MIHLFIINVGKGNCSLLRDGDEYVLFDAGQGDHILTFCYERNILSIDSIFISHSDIDHIGGVSNLIANNIQIKKIYLNSDYVKDSSKLDSIIYSLYALRKQGKTEITTQLTTSLNGAINTSNVHIKILFPNDYLALIKRSGSKDIRGLKFTANSLSAIIKIQHNESSTVLLTGDIDYTGLQNFLLMDPDLTASMEADILVYPHHGGKATSSMNDVIEKSFIDELISLVGPKKIVFSVGDHSEKHPNEIVINTICNLQTEISLIATGHSPVLERYLNKCSHKIFNNTGTIRVDLKTGFLQFET